jgi:hypothetical protein
MKVRINNMKVKDLKKAIAEIPDDFDIQINNDDHEPDAITIDFKCKNVTFIVGRL